MNNYLLMHEAAFIGSSYLMIPLIPVGHTVQYKGYIYTSDFSSSQTFSTNTYFLCVWVY